MTDTSDSALMTDDFRASSPRRLLKIFGGLLLGAGVLWGAWTALQPGGCEALLYEVAGPYQSDVAGAMRVNGITDEACDEALERIHAQMETAPRAAETEIKMHALLDVLSSAMTPEQELELRTKVYEAQRAEGMPERYSRRLAGLDTP
ncbi:MAG: hypothetical protein AAGA54_10475 [Myxococcota bacterium]